MKKPTYEELEAEVERLETELRAAREELGKAPVEPDDAKNGLVNLSESSRPPARPLHTDGH